LLQAEDPSDPSSCSDVRVYYHQSEVKRKSKGASVALPAPQRQLLITQKLLWAQVQLQKASLLVARGSENGINLYFSAFQIVQRAASMLQDVLGPESPKVAAALRDMGQVQALRGCFRDALDIYKRALRIQTRATGYDGYAANARVADIMHRMAEIKIVLGKHRWYFVLHKSGR